MTRVHFYHNAAAPLTLACELAGRAYNGGRKAVVLTSGNDVAARLDELLWSFEPLSFIPHVRAESRLAAETPILIAVQGGVTEFPHHDLLLNLTHEVPANFESFRIVVEVVGQTDAERGPARARWRHYQSCGLPMQAFDSVRREAL